DIHPACARPRGRARRRDAGGGYCAAQSFPMTGLPVEFRVGDRLTLAKSHPCGSTAWQIVRIGADIGLVCEGCGRRVLVERRQLERRVKAFVERGPAPNEGDE